VKRPDLLVVDGALAPFGERRTESLIGFLRDATAGRTLAVVLPNDRHAHVFEALVRLEDRRATLDEAPPAPPAAPAEEPALEEEPSGPGLQPARAAAE
jgi:putative ABC transport system ATP-binding protein